MYYIYQQQSGGYDLKMKYYKTEKVFIEHLKLFLKAWVHLKGVRHSDDSDVSDDDEVYTEKENYNIEDVIKNMWKTSYITVEDEDGINSLEWGKIYFEDKEDSQQQYY